MSRATVVIWASTDSRPVPFGACNSYGSGLSRPRKPDVEIQKELRQISLEIETLMRPRAGIQCAEFERDLYRIQCANCLCPCGTEVASIGVFAGLYTHQSTTDSSSRKVYVGS